MISEKDRQLSVVLRQYQKEAHKTAIYPPEHAVGYVVLGLMGEIYEFGDAETREDAIPELGDLFWFTAELATVFVIDLGALYLNPDQEFPVPAGDSYAVSVMNLYLLEYASVAAKHLRDGRPILEETYAILQKVLSTLLSIADVMGVDPTELLAQNITKLEDRQRRGVLGGSGNKR